MSLLTKPFEIFCSYSPEDEALCIQLEKHLSSLRHRGLLSVWHRRKLVPGTNWAEAIDGRMNKAAIILLLISADFLSSDYCYGVEMTRALQRHADNEARVIPILARPVLWQGGPFAHLVVLPKNGSPISRRRDRDAALEDVANGIQQVIMDLEVLPSSTSTKEDARIWNIPFPRNRLFLGRDDLLADLEYRLQTGKSLVLSQPQAISGLGGVGKTQLAVEYAYRSRQNYQAVLWTQADSRDALVSGFVELAQLLQISFQSRRDQKVLIEGVKHWLTQHEHWLLIFDNVDNPALLLDFFPHSSSGHIILTTRAQAVNQIAQHIEVNVLDEETGILLLLRRTGLLAYDASIEQAGDASYMLALQICRELGVLPLALDQAGAYIEETRCGLQQYLDLFHNHRPELLSWDGGLIKNHEVVAKTWALSFDKVQKDSSMAADLLRFCSVLCPGAIPEELLTEGVIHLKSRINGESNDPLAYNHALATLTRYSLIQRNIHERTISVHRLIQAILQDTMFKQDQDLWTQRAISALAAVFPTNTHTNWELCERLVPHALVCLGKLRSPEASREFFSLSIAVARYLYELYGHERYQDTETLYLHTLSVKERALGAENPDLVPLLNVMVELYKEHGKYGEGETLALQALDICERTLGPNDPQLATALYNLANIYRERGKYEEGEILSQRALDIYEKSLGLEHTRVAYALNSLAIFYRRQKKSRDAESLSLRALSIGENTVGLEHPLVAVCNTTLANIYYDQGRYEEATIMYQRSLNIWEKIRGPEHLQIALALHNIANLHRVQGKYREAETFYQRALEMRKRMLGPIHPSLASTLYGLADLYKKLKKYEEAQALYLQALTMYEKTLGTRHITTQELRTEYTHFLQEKKQPEKDSLLETDIQPEL